MLSLVPILSGDLLLKLYVVVLEGCDTLSKSVNHVVKLLRGIGSYRLCSRLRSR